MDRNQKIITSGPSDGLAVQPPNSRPKQLPNKNPSKWSYFFIVLGVLQILGIGVFSLLMIISSANQKTIIDMSNVSGAEFIGMVLFVTLFSPIGPMVLINLIGLPLYMVRHRLRGKRLFFSILSLSISIILVLNGLYNVYQAGVSVSDVKYIDEQSKQIRIREQIESDNRQRIESEERVQVEGEKPESL